ncbi:MAG: histidine phosphatase family protein [Chloroflexi bacterium]|nr:histidine phosphatase family protein [Chloroflexota bacterium]
MRLSLVRHAAVTVRPGSLPQHWRLSPEGRAAAEALAGAPHWAGLTTVYTSPEPKALATAQRLAAPHGSPVRIEAGLREVSRPAAMYDDYPAIVRRFLAGERIDGWESREEAQRRVEAGIDALVAQSNGEDVAAVSHGLALTLYIAGLLGLGESAAFDLWSAMRFPDVAVLDPEVGRLARGFGEDPALGENRDG